MARERKYSAFRRKLRAQIRSHFENCELDKEDKDRSQRRSTSIASHGFDHDDVQRQQYSRKVKDTSSEESGLYYEPRVSILYTPQEAVETCYDPSLFQNESSNNTCQTKAATLGRRKLSHNSLNTPGCPSTDSSPKNRFRKEKTQKIQERRKNRMKAEKKGRIETKTIYSAKSKRKQKSPKSSLSSCPSDSTYKQLTNKFHKHYKYFDDVLKNGVQGTTKSTASKYKGINIDETVKCVLSKFCTKETKEHVFATTEAPKERLKGVLSIPSMNSCSSKREMLFSRRKSFSQTFRKMLKRYEKI